MSLDPHFLTNSFGMQSLVFTGLSKEQLDPLFFGSMPGVSWCVAQGGCVWPLLTHR